MIRRIFPPIDATAECHCIGDLRCVLGVAKPCSNVAAADQAFAVDFQTRNVAQDVAPWRMSSFERAEIAFGAMAKPRVEHGAPSGRKLEADDHHARARSRRTEHAGSAAGVRKTSCV